MLCIPMDNVNPSDQRAKMLEKLLLEESLNLYNEDAPTHYHIHPLEVGVWTSPW